jgi:hypothetical protein
LKTQNTPVRQPSYIRLINRLGRQLANAGIAKPDLRSDLLIQQAQKNTGLQNFGDESFRIGLEKLTEELRAQAGLSQVGRVVAYFNLLDHLTVRLRMIEYRENRPEVSQQRIQRPLFILGLPRTATTILYELIAQDPSLRSPATWEVSKPFPPARKASYQSDKRIRSVDKQLAVNEKLCPAFNSIHAIGAKLPQECVYLLASNFISEQFGYMYNIPEYRAWALEQDMTASYAWHANFLQHLQVDYAGEGWVLKTPAHLAYLKYLLAQYPDAAIVWTHRRPVDAIASFSSLLSTLRGGFSDTIDPKAIGEHELRHFSKIVASGMEQRSEFDQGQFFDVGFSAICSDPLSVIGDIYDYFGMHLSDEAESRMREYLQRHPRGLYGEHQYSRGEFGLEDSRESEMYAQYLSQYGRFLR